MERRGIRRDEVEEAIANRGTMYPSADDESRVVILGRTAAGRSLKVVVERDDHDCVITVADREDER
jgi:hypothetical protein